MGATFRPASADEALLVAALTIQAARAADLSVPAGFMDRFADTWRSRPGHHPVWICECDGEHAGFLQTTRTRALPWPGRSGGGELREERLFVRADFSGRGLESGLREAAANWAASRGVTWLPASP